MRTGTRLRPLVTRRAVLGAAAAGAIAAPIAIAAAQPPLRRTKTEAEYQGHPRGGFSCAVCTQFRPPGSCVIVEGKISPNGWCEFFDLGD